MGGERSVFPFHVPLAFLDIFLQNLRHFELISNMPFYNHNAYYHYSPPPSPLLDPVPSFERKESFQNKPKSLEPSAELVEEYNTCPAASRATCRFVDNGPSKLDVYSLKLYKRQLPGSDGRALVIGIATQSPSGDLTPLVLIGNDDSGRGIHFTGTAIHDPSRTFVACLRRSATLHPVYRHYIYLDYVKSLQNRSASFIWDWWESGQDMDRLDDLIRDGQ